MRSTFLLLTSAALFATVSFAPAQSTPTPAPTATPASAPSATPAKRSHKKKETPAPAASPAPAATAAPAAPVAASPTPKLTRAEKKAAKAAAAGSPAAAAATPAAETPNATPAPGGGAGMVWVNTKSHVYHQSASRWYGKTKTGKYMSEKDALAEGDKAAEHKE